MQRAKKAERNRTTTTRAKVDWGKTAQFVFSDDGDDDVAAVSVDISGGGGSEEDGGKRQ